MTYPSSPQSLVWEIHFFQKQDSFLVFRQLHVYKTVKDIFPHHTAKNLLTIRFMQSCEQRSIGSILLVNFWETTKNQQKRGLAKKKEKTNKVTWFLPSKKVSWAFKFFFHSFTFEISFFQNETFFSSKFWNIPILRFLDSCRRRRKYRKKCFFNEAKNQEQRRKSVNVNFCFCSTGKKYRLLEN